MPNNDLKMMSRRVCGADNAEVMSVWEKLRRDAPDEFIKYKARFAAYPQAGQIPEVDLAKINAAVKREVTQQRDCSAAMYNAAYNGCKAVDAIAKIAKMPHLSEAVKLSKQSLDFAQQLGCVADILSAGGGLAGFAALANPTMALVGIGLQMMDCFIGESGPSYEEIVLLQLREISQQIADLHEEMLHEFGQVHEHLRLLHNTVLDCTAALEASIERLGNQMQGFRNDVIGRLIKIEESIEDLRREVAVGQRDILLQDLKTLCADVDARINHHVIVNEEAEVQRIAHRLEHNWILGQSAACSLTGSQIRVTYDNDIRMLEPSNTKLQGRMGYIASVAQSMGFDLTATADILSVERNKIVHLEIFEVAVNQYLELRKVFSGYVQDDVRGSRFSNIQLFANNTLNFIRKIQRSENLFNALFANYWSAIGEINAAIQGQIDAADLEQHSFLQNNEISLRDNIVTLCSKFVGKHPKVARITTADVMQSSGTTIHGAKFPEFDVQDLSTHHMLNLPVEVLIGEALKLGDIKCSYTAMFAQRFSDPGIGVEDYDSGLYTSFGTKVGSSDHVYASRRDHFYARYIFKFNLSNYYEHTMSVDRYVPVQDAHSFWPFFINPNLASCVVMPNPVVNENALINLRMQITNTLLQKRKELVAQRLLNGDSTQFDQALQHLESARRRLLAFGLLAGLPYEFMQKIFDLPASSTVRNDLLLYTLAGDINSSYWHKPAAETINAVNAACIGLLRAEIAQPSLDSPIARKICEIDDLLSSSKRTYTEHRNNMPRSTPRW